MSKSIEEFEFACAALSARADQPTKKAGKKAGKKTGRHGILSSTALPEWLLVALLVPSVANAQAVQYKNGTNNTSTLFIINNSATLSVSGSAEQSGDIEEDFSPLPIQKIGNGTLILSGTNNYAGLTTISAGALNIRNNLGLGTAAGGTVVDAGAALELQGSIAIVNEALTLNGTGVAGGGALRNVDGNNTIGGGITLGSDSSINVDAGALFLNGGIIGTGQNLTFGGPNTLVVDGAIATGSGSLTKNGTGTVTLNGGNSYTGTTTINGGILLAASGTAIADTGAVVLANVAGASLQINEAETIGSLSGGGNAGGNVFLVAELTTGGDGTSTNFFGAISDDSVITPSSAQNLTKIGAGAQTLTGANTYGGLTTISAGALNIQNGTGLGTTARGTVVDAGAALEIQGGIIIGAEALTLNGTGIAGGGALRSVSGGNVFGGAITLATDSRINTDTGSMSLTGTITGADRNLTLGGNGGTYVFGVIGTGAGGVSKIGSGDAALIGTNTYTGATTINAGTLILEGDQAIADMGAVIVANVAGARLGVNDPETIGSLSGGGTTGGEAYLAFDLTTGANNTNTTFAGVISSGPLISVPAAVTTTTPPTIPGGLIKVGTGTFTVTGNNTYGGLTTIRAGTLQIGDGRTTGSLGTNMSVVNNGTLTFNRSDLVTLSKTISGTGALVQAGTGTLELTAASTYSGTTTIKSGIVQIGSTFFTSLTNQQLGDDSATNGLILDGGALEVVSSFVDFSRPITITTGGGGISIADTLTLMSRGERTFTGKLTKTGGGTLDLLGASTGAGGIDLNGGRITVTDNSALGTGTLTARPGTALRFRVPSMGSTTIANNIVLVPGGGVRIESVTALDGTPPRLSGNISGGGSLSMPVGGPLELTGNNTFTGGFTLNSGRLGVSGTSPIGTGTFVFAQGQTLYAVGDATIGNQIQLTDFAGVRSIFNMVVDTAGFNVLLGGNISNGADSPIGLTKNGLGTLTLSGVAGFNGSSSVNAGTLIVNGTLNGPSLSVALGAVLGGVGVTPQTTISDGVLSPGNSIGTITVNGDLTLGGNTTTRIEIDGATIDRINVVGNASIDGALQLVPLGGSYTFAAPYTFLATGTGGTVSGQFSSVSTVGTFGVGVTSAVTYTPTAAQLTLTAAPLVPIIIPPMPPVVIVPPATPPVVVPPPPTPPVVVPPVVVPSVLNIGRPSNAVSVAAGIDRAVGRGANASPFFNVYNQPTRAALIAAVNSLSGEVHTSVNALGVQASDQFLRVMLDPANNGRTPAASADLVSGIKIWGAYFGETDRTDDERFGIGSSTRQASGWNFALGADLRVHSSTVIGIAAAYGRANASLANGLGTAAGDVFQFGINSKSRFGRASLNLAGAYSVLDIATNRGLPVIGGGTLNAKYTARGWSGRAELAYQAVQSGELSISPLAAVQAHSVRTPRFAEMASGTITAAAVNAAGNTNVTLRSELGMRFDLISGGPNNLINVFARGVWAHYFNKDAAFSGALSGLAGSDFTVIGAQFADDSAILSIGADVKVGGNMTLGATVNTQLSDRQRALSGSARFTIAL